MAPAQQAVASCGALPQLLRSFADLRTGDIVVHEDHGIARFTGFDTKTVMGVTRDYLELEFVNGKVSMPVDMLAKISRYVGADGAHPPKKKPKKRAAKPVAEKKQTVAKLEARPMPKKQAAKPAAEKKEPIPKAKPKEQAAAEKQAAQTSATKKSRHGTTPRTLASPARRMSPRFVQIRWWGEGVGVRARPRFP